MGPVSPEIASRGRGDGPSAVGLPGATVDLLERAGFTVAARLPIGAYDAIVPEAWRSTHALPGARSALVLGTAGGAFEAAWLGAAASGPDPADDHARAVCARAIESLEAQTGERATAWLYADRRSLDETRAEEGGTNAGSAVFADFVALAEAGGLGTRSPLGLLLHSGYGPWWSVRALILTTWAPDTAGSGGSSEGPGSTPPCLDCPAPCIEACPVGAVQLTGFEASTCGAHRLEGEPCESRCAARSACVVGPEYAYAARAAEHYAAASLRWIRGDRSESDEVP